ncbi:conjugal transfer protein [Kitasatospora sp. NPDC048722]|uniref:conjugal transfer protein n=1 Tax=Kitasatospora sp. NPDC048722 TaxID=3155639 RepID=UPI0033F8FDAA
MPSVARIFRLLAGLPEPAAPGPAEQPPHAPLPPPGTGAVPSPPSNPWDAAGRDLAARTSRQGAASATEVRPPVPAPAVPWVPQDEKSGAVFARRLGRGLLWTVVGLAAITGIRSWIIPPKAPIAAAPAPASTGPAYPVEAAQALAGRFARAYLTWDEAAAPQRAQALAGLLPAGADTGMGWDGKGRQDVVDIVADAVSPGPQGQARVRVDVLVRPAATAPATPPPAAGAPAPASAATPAAAFWVALEVPVATAAPGRLVVSGQPGLVGLPEHGPALQRPAAVEADSPLSTATQPAVEAFFKAYATSGSGGAPAVTAPGAVLPPLPAGIEFRSMAAWTIDKGDGTDRTGTARVSWALAGAQIEQTYRVTLTRVSSTAAATWQVSAVNGGATG